MLFCSFDTPSYNDVTEHDQAIPGHAWAKSNRVAPPITMTIGKHTAYVTLNEIKTMVLQTCFQSKVLNI